MDMSRFTPEQQEILNRVQLVDEWKEPLADALFGNPQLDPQQEAKAYIKVVAASEGVEAINVPDVKAALEGARDILSERFAETAPLLAKLRTRLQEQGIVTSSVVAGKEQAEEEKFRDYYAYSEIGRAHV